MVAVAAVGFSIVLSGCQQTPKDYDECVLENVKSGMGETAVSAIQQSCDVKYPDKGDKNVNADQPTVKIKDSDWYMLRDGTKKPDGISMYIDKNSVDIVGNYRYFWLKYFKGRGGIESKDFQLYRIYADCSGKTFTTIERQDWKNGMREDIRKTNSTDTVTPDTFTAKLYNYVCSYESK
jgi:hypothetical protein